MKRKNPECICIRDFLANPVSLERLGREPLIWAKKKSLERDMRPDSVWWRRWWDSNPRASRQNDFESCAEKDFPEKSRSERVSLSLNFGRYTEPFRREKAKNGVGTNEMGNASFGEIWHIFLEKCKISCKIIQARFPLWLLVFCHPARRSLFPNARFKEDFLYY